MNKRQKFLYYSGVFFIILLVILAFQIRGQSTTSFEKTIEKPIVVDEPIVEKTIKKTGINIKSLQESYQNNDIVAYLVIPDVMSSVVVQSSDNEYYLRRLLDGSYNIKGTPFMDYRTTFEDRKILIYGHSGDYEDLPFLVLHRYENESFYQEHPTIYLYSATKKYTYRIFSSYLETEDYDYVNIKSFRGLTWLEHIQKLQRKSDFSTNISLTDKSKVLVLQTCNTENGIVGGRYRLVVGVLTTIEDNLYE